jgi:DNA-binding GntR family transcriptional regulator
MSDPTPQDVLDDAFGSPGDHPTIAGSVANQLRELILTGKLPPGTPLRLS